MSGIHQYNQNDALAIMVTFLGLFKKTYDRQNLVKNSNTVVTLKYLPMNQDRKREVNETDGNRDEKGRNEFRGKNFANEL
jgi:hypothetical protein